MTPEQYLDRLDDEDCTCPGENRTRAGCIKCASEVFADAIAAATTAERERVAKLIMDISPPTEWAFARVLVKAIRTAPGEETK